MNPDHQSFVKMPSRPVWLELDVQKVMELIENSYLRAQEEAVYLAVIAWIEHDLQKRKRFTEMLMNEVRIVSLPVEFLELIVEMEPLIVLEPSLVRLRNTAILYRRSEAQARAQIRKMFWQDCKYVRPRVPYVKPQRIYAFGGKISEEANESIKLVESFDFASGVWSQVTETPLSRLDSGIAEYNGEIWVVGGYDCSAPGQRALNTVKIYDLTSHEWSDGPTLKTARYGLCLVEFGGRLIALGGKRTSEALKSTEVCDLSRKIWEHRDFMIHERYLFNAISLRTRLYVIGGEKKGVDPQMEFYSLETRQWTLLPEIIPGRKNFDVAVLDELLYVMSGDARMTFSVFNPANDRWTFIPRPADKFMAEIALVAYDRFLYMVGGAGESGATSSFWRYDPEKDEWSAMPDCIQARCGAKLLMIDS